MDYFEKLVSQIARHMFVAIFGTSMVVGAMMWFGLTQLQAVPPVFVVLVSLVVGLTLSAVLAKVAARTAAEPVDFLARAILHVSPGEHQTTAPDLAKSHIGHALVSSLALQVYQLASSGSVPSSGRQTVQSRGEAASIQSQTVMTNFPLPILVINKDQVIVYANPAAVNYLGRIQSDVTGANVYSVIDLSFSEDTTFDDWLTDCQANKATASRFWSRVKLNAQDQAHAKQFDMAAYYNKNNTESAETIITFFDKTKDYASDNDALSFIALAVHELRTPLTILRGYIEVFDEEVRGKVNQEVDDFIDKMQVSAQQLSTFVGNILNVARVEENQLYLNLHEENWEQVLRSIVDDMQLRARMYNKKLELNIQPNLPAVALDKVSIYEVVSNLVDNAIKYSPNSEQIIIRSYLRDDGMVETTVQDFGIGIPGSIIGRLFEKFYRNHRSRASIGGTGLGLYLSKAIVSAHGGQIWVKSKENEGSTFGFSVQKYEDLADSLKNADNQDIQRTAHGWIKNHSFYRR